MNAHRLARVWAWAWHRTGRYNIVKHPAFDHFILAVIIASSVLLAWQNPLWDPESAASVAVDKANIAANAIFVAEMAAKVVAMGFLARDGAYVLWAGCCWW